MPESSEVRRRHRGKVSVDKMVGTANIAKALGGVHGPAAQVGSCSPYLDTQAGSGSRFWLTFLGLRDYPNDTFADNRAVLVCGSARQA